VPNFQPYSFQEHNTLTGSAIAPVSQALKDSQVKFTLRLYDNYSLILKALRKNEIQGFFLASKNLERDKYSVFSKPITFNYWSWFVLKSNDIDVSDRAFKINSKVATVGKTNTYRWLTRSGYRVLSSDIQRLPNLLITKQVDAVFVAQAVFESRMKTLAIHPKTFVKTVEAKKPFGIYISKYYLQSNEGFMKVLNGHITTREF
jgi:polar amino acid transport system substrate-binding protein